MSFSQSGFLYRRLARLVPCVLPGIGDQGLPLGSKYDVASARDVFLSAHYWRLFEYLSVEPKLIVDLGAHCGHFTILCHLLILEKFQRDASTYVLVEPVTSLVARATENLAAAGILRQAQLHQGLVGRKQGTATLLADPQNLLASSVSQSTDRKSAADANTFSYLDLLRLLPEGQLIDVLKVDIEGSERDLLAEYPEVLARTRILLIELHGDDSALARLHEQITGLGMCPVSTPIRRGGEVMRIYVGPEQARIGART